MSRDVDRFVDSMGLAFDELGGSRMMGRILGWLLICEPPQQSEPQICVALGASKGAVNTIVRQLVKGGLLERVVVPGERATFVRARADAWTNLLRQQLSSVHAMQRLAREGLEVLSDAPEEQRARLIRLRDFYDFVAREIEPMFERFEEGS